MDQLAKTIDWLYSLEARGEIYKLERMEAALEVIGNPHRRLRVVHIAGTKGKGSVVCGALVIGPGSTPSLTW
jgi:folylpolyglutamate synthase/dihydropteroate synthase